MPGSRPQLLVIGGRTGVGKTSVAAEIHQQLRRAEVQHAVIEGDALDLAWPAPWEHGLAERNLAAMWRNFCELGYRRLIYTNTMSVLEIAALTSAMGDDPAVTAVLLTCSDITAARRLAAREIGSGLDAHLARGAAHAIRLETRADDAVQRIATDGRTIGDIADEILTFTGWLTSTEGQNDHE